MEVVKSWGAFIAMGALAGAVAARFIAPAGLKIIFAALALSMATRMLLNDNPGEAGEARFGATLQKALSSLVGFFSALMGIGGGTFAVSFMTLYGRNPREAVATSSGMGVLIAIPAVVGFVWAGWNDPLLPPFSLGYVNLVGMALIAPLSVLAAPWGAAIAHAISHKALIRAFAFFLAVTSVQMFYRLFAG